MTGSHGIERGGARASLAAALVVSLAGGCVAAPAQKTLLVHEDEAAAPRAIWELVFVREFTVPENYRYQTEEFASVAADPSRGLIYVGSRDGTLLALDDRRGEVVWELDLGGGVSSTPVLVVVDLELPQVRVAAPNEQPDWMLVGTDDGAMVALDLTTRETRWRYRTGGVIRNPAVPGEGVVHFVNSRDQIYTVDVSDGEWVWEYAGTFQKDFTVQGRAGLALLPSDVAAETGRDAMLFTGFGDGRVAALDATSGAVLWVEPLAPGDEDTFVDVDTTPVVRPERGEVIVANQASGVFSLSIEDGARRWNIPMRGVGSLVEGPGGSLLAASSLEGMYAIEVDGRIRWRRQLDPGALARPLVVGNTVVLAHSDVGLLVFAAGDGELLGRFDNGSGSSAAPVFDPVLERVYATSDRGQVYALSFAPE